MVVSCQFLVERDIQVPSGLPSLLAPLCSGQNLHTEVSGKWAEGTGLVLAQQAHSMFTWIAEEVLRDWGRGWGKDPFPQATP